MHQLLRDSLTIAALGFAAPCGAQPAPAEAEGPEIVVEGPANRERRVRDYIGALTSGSVGTQIGRFEGGVCVSVVGLSSQNEAVANRMRQIAIAAGIPLAPVGCTPNALVVATRDKEALIEALRREQPDYFKRLSPWEIRRLARSDAPAVAWQTEWPFGADVVDVAGDDIPSVNEVSRIRSATRPYFLTSVVVVEADALVGLTTTQLADYAAMRVFARTEPSRLEGSSASTILSILHAPAGTEVPITLTEWDLAFLRTLYGRSDERFGIHHRSEMRRRLREELGANSD